MDCNNSNFIIIYNIYIIYYNNTIVEGEVFCTSKKLIVALLQCCNVAKPSALLSPTRIFDRLIA